MSSVVTEGLKPKYKAYLVLGPKIYKIQWVYNEIPEQLVYGSRTLKLKMVLWNCRNRAVLDKHKYVEVQALVYR